MKSAIVAGDPESSELVARITSDDPDNVMPPPDSERSLTKEQIGLLQQWIKQGGEYQAHWSFISPKRPELPKLKQTDLAANPIDHFILALLESRNISLAEPADRETLIRRATFDLSLIHI